MSIKIAKQIVQQTERSLICGTVIGTQLVHIFKSPKVSQPWSVPLNIGNNLSIPAKTVRIFNDKAGIKLKALNKFSPKTYVLKEDESVEFAHDDLIKVIIRHDSLVEIADEDMFKFETLRSFDLVCFTKSEFVPEPYLEGK